MCELCIHNFLQKSDPSCIERHSDSSDFDEPLQIPIVAPKGGYHSLLNGKLRRKAEKDLTNNNQIRKNIKNYEYSNYTKPKINYENSKSVDYKHKKNEYLTRKDDKRNRGDQNSFHLEENNTKLLVRNKLLPGLSAILKRSNNCIKHFNSIENQANEKNGDKLFCPHCQKQHKHKHITKCHYAVQPVYAVKDIHEFPLALNRPYYNTNSSLPNNDRNQKKCCSVESSSSTSEKEIENYKYEKQLQTYEKLLEKNNTKINSRNDNKTNTFNIRQRLALKPDLNKVGQDYSTFCQANCVSTASDALNKLESSSSAFWNFLAQKVNKKCPLRKFDCTKECDCDKTPQSCNPETCKSIDISVETDNFIKSELAVPKPGLGLQVRAHKRRRYGGKVKCECNVNKQNITMNKEFKDATSSVSQESLQTCQEPHDEIAKAIADKYNGEILCIHNPPCILINGCLNMESPKTLPTQASSWPVTVHNKKHSFVQMCRKIKRTKNKNYEQASQYNPPYSQLEQCLPEFKSEKIIQSVCNHNPPCQVVHRCYRAKHPKLTNSCVHVPMCKEMPKCLIQGDGLEKQNVCPHDPKCKDLPRCAKKYFVLTAKESIGTQAKPEVKMVCRHEPPCLKIPKCLAQVICSDHIPFKIIPGCSHSPCCDMIPACCRKCAKDMISVTSQHPSASCRIV